MLRYARKRLLEDDATARRLVRSLDGYSIETVKGFIEAISEIVGGENDQIRDVALLRVSTTDQELGPEAQGRAIETWARREGIEIRSWRLEAGVSGATPLEKRTILLRALDDLKTLRAGVLVVAKRDRLARDVVSAALIERLVERSGARLCAADGTTDAKGPEGMLLRGMTDLFASYERLIISSRTKAALAAKRGEGRKDRRGSVRIRARLRW